MGKEKKKKKPPKKKKKIFIKNIARSNREWLPEV